MKLPYHMFCEHPHPLLYQLSDGRFQVMEESEVAPMMVGFEYVLVEQSFADYLDALLLPELTIANATLYDPRNKREIWTHRQLLIGQCFSGDRIQALDLDGERLLLMDSQAVFVSPLLKERLEASPFHYLRFREGLSWFAAGRTDGERDR